MSKKLLFFWSILSDSWIISDRFPVVSTWSIVGFGRWTFYKMRYYCEMENYRLLENMSQVKQLYHLELAELVWIANQLGDFHMIKIAEGHFIEKWATRI